MHSRYDRQETTSLMSQCNGQNKPIPDQNKSTNTHGVVANCMVKTYMVDEARFPPSMWATSPSDEEDVPRTTNAAEAFHMHFKKRFNSPHPNLYAIAFKLLEYQEIIYIKLQSLQARRTTSAAQQTKAQFIQDMCNQYMYFYLIIIIIMNPFTLS